MRPLRMHCEVFVDKESDPKQMNRCSHVKHAYMELQVMFVQIYTHVVKIERAREICWN